MSIDKLLVLASKFLVQAKYQKGMLTFITDTATKLPMHVTAMGKPLVLVVEDDEDTLAMLKLMLEGRGYTVLTASTISKALELANSHDDIQSLVTDYYIHGGTAVELLHQLGDRKPKNVVLLSGKHFAGDPKHEVPGIDSHVSKPFNFKKLIEKIDVKHPTAQETASAG